MQINGLGLGYRRHWASSLLAQQRPVGWVELLAENHFDAPEELKAIAAHYPVVVHGVGLDLLGSQPFDRRHLAKLKQVLRASGALLFSEHLCWSRKEGRHFHDLLPVPLTEAMLDYASQRVEWVQQELSVPFAVENLAQYGDVPGSSLSQGEFLTRLCQRTGCKLLLDVNNLVVSAANLERPIASLLAPYQSHQVAYAHVAGHEKRGERLIDTHHCAPQPAVLDCLSRVLASFGPKPVLLEWDSELPPFEELKPWLTILRAVLQRPSPETPPSPPPGRRPSPLQS